MCVIDGGGMSSNAPTRPRTTVDHAFYKRDLEGEQRPSATRSLSH